jgi:hypothetical protein
MISAWDCLHFATLELVRSTPIKQRIVAAYRQYLSQIPDEQLPLEIRDGYTRMLQTLRGVQPLRGEDEVTASVRKMSGSEADACAAQIVSMFAQLCRAQVAQGRPVADVVMLHGPDTELDGPMQQELLQQEFEIPASIARA